MDLASEYQDTGQAPWANLKAGYRFSETNLPANAIITKAELILTFIWDYGTSVSFSIHGENLTQNSLTFSTANADISNRNQTTANVNWSLPANPGYQSSLPHTVELTEIVNEFVVEGWNPGDPMTFIISPLSGFRSFAAHEFEGQGKYSPQLRLHYRLPEPACSGLSGLAFEDFNDNGQFDSAGEQLCETGLPEVGVNIYNDGGLVYTTITDNFGNWSFPAANAGSTYRVEYDLPQEYQPASASALGSSSETSFAIAPECCIDFGLHRPADFACEVPQLVTVCNVQCGAANENEPVLVSIPETELGNSTTDINDYLIANHPIMVPVRELGSIWGLAYNKCEDVIYTGAKFSNLTDMGSGGTGAIYCIDNSANDGTNETVTEVSNVLVQIPNAGNDPAQGLECGASNDPAFMKYADKVGLGDVDLNETCDTLYAVNLYNRSLVAIPVNGCTATGGIQTYGLPIPIGTFACSNDTIQPFGLACHKGKVYVGAVCTAERTQDRNNLWAYVYEFSHGSGFDSTPVLDFPLNYVRSGKNFINSAGISPDLDWHPWRTEWNAANTIADSLYKENYNQVSYPQAVLSDIEFDKGDMTLGFMDRFANQFAYDEDPSGHAGQNAADGTNDVGATPAGEILRAGALPSGGWVLEDNALVNGVQTGSQRTEGVNTSEGPGGGEYYHGDRFGSTHDESTLGGLAQIPGHVDVAVTAFDPTGIYFEHSNDPRYASGGIITLNNRTGLQQAAWEGYYSTPSAFGKGNGFGDVEYICACAEIEIGNRIWFDIDGDGIQDPGEPPIAGVLVNLYSAPGQLLAQVSTDSEGRYFFSSDNVPAGLSTGQNYFLAVDASNFSVYGELELAGNNYGRLTVSNSSNMGNADTNDSDAIDSALTPSGITLIDLGEMPYIAISTGESGFNDFTYDFGFRPNAECSLETAGLANVACQLEGTGAAAEGQIIFSLDPMGANLSKGYQISATQAGNAMAVGDLNGDAILAAYGQEQFFSLPAGTAGNGDVQISIRDIDNPNCELFIIISDPGTCEPDCSCANHSITIMREVPLTDTNWSTLVSVPKFDDLNGCRVLQSVLVKQVASLGQMAAVENEHTAEASIEVNTSGSLTLSFNGNTLNASPPNINVQQMLPPSVLVPAQGSWPGDLMGSTLLAMASDINSAFANLQSPLEQNWWVTQLSNDLQHDDDIMVFESAFSEATASGLYTAASDLTFFTGSGIVNLAASSSGVSSISSATDANYVVRTMASMLVEVTYEYSCIPPQILAINPGACDPESDSYALSIDLAYHCGLEGAILVNGISFEPDGSSPDTFSLPALPANGSMSIPVSVSYANDPSCATAEGNYNAPISCASPDCTGSDCVMIRVQAP